MTARKPRPTKVRMEVDLGGLAMKNPVTTASGTFGAGMEYADFVDVASLGAVTTKGVSLDGWEGNASPRIAETASGMLNSIGLQNPGVAHLKAVELPWLAGIGATAMVNVSGHSFDEYVAVIKALEEAPVAAYEVNISCPNVDAGGMTMGCHVPSVEKVVSLCRAATKRPLIVKLTPNVTDITEIAKAAEAAGADAVETAEVPVDPAWGIVCGRAGVFRTYRFFPHRARGEGFFAAVARKSPDAGGRPRRPRSRREVLTAPTRDEVRELSRWLHDAERMRFFRAGDRFYACAAAQEEALHALAGALPVICSGVEMGQIFKGTLRPAHALALSTSLDRGAVATAELAHDEALDYLRRRDVAAHRFAEGMNLVCCGGRPLGWAKRIGSRVNNLYPESLRIWMNVSDKPSAEPNAVRVMPKRENDGKKAN